MKKTWLLFGALILASSEVLAGSLSFRIALPGIKPESIQAGGNSASGCEPGSIAFSYTGSAQTFAVPAACSTMTVVGWGAGGGPSTVSGSIGGAGAYASATFAVQAGQQYTVIVGQGGGTGSTGGSATAYGGGGSGGGYCGTYCGGAGGGGGGSFVQFGGKDIFAAGGGGGGAWEGVIYSGSTVTYSAYTGYNGRVIGSGGNQTASDTGGSGAGGGGGGGHLGGTAGATTGGPNYYGTVGGESGVSYANSAATGVSSIAGNTSVAPNSTSSDYVAGIAVGGSTGNRGGNGRIVVYYQ
jgi:hypothetical protein